MAKKKKHGMRYESRKGKPSSGSVIHVPVDKETLACLREYLGWGQRSPFIRALVKTYFHLDLDWQEAAALEKADGA